LGRSATHYKSQQADILLEVIWLEQEQVPVLLKRTEKGYTVESRVTTLFPLTEQPCGYQRSTEYRFTDFADIGDMESDPVIKAILPKIGVGHAHQ
jgi:hypothetical protein